jgi:hypothetical protein
MKTWEETLEFVQGIAINEDKYGFTRTIKFARDGIDYFIEWWKNIGYLSIQNQKSNKIVFDDFQINETWPSHEGGLRFEFEGNVVALIAKESKR